MLTFTLEINDGRNTQEVSGFVWGHMTIAGPGGEVTSKGKQPDQSLMIFPSIVELLDGIRRFLADRHASRYQFVATDSSFQFTASREAGERIALAAEGKVLDRVQPSQLVEAIWNGLASFAAVNAPRLKAGDAVAGDFKSSIEEFGRVFNLATRI
jgi:hypothetical protein